MFNVRCITDIEMAFNGREKALCVMDYARLLSNNTIQHVFMSEFSKQSATAMQIWT